MTAKDDVIKAVIESRNDLERLLIKHVDEVDSLRAENEKLRAVVSAAYKVVRWDWSENDSDCVADITALSMALDAASTHCPAYSPSSPM